MTDGVTEWQCHLLRCPGQLKMGKWAFQDWICNSYRAHDFEIFYESIVLSSIVETKLSIWKYLCQPFMKISNDTSNSKSGWAVSCYQKDITFGLCLRCIACFSKFSDLYLGWFHVKHEQVLCIWDYKLTRQILILVWRPEVRSFKWSVSQRNIEKMRLVLRCPTENMIDLNV